MQEAVHILGPGALGSLWAGLLASRGGQPVQLVGRRRLGDSWAFELDLADDTLSISLPYCSVRDLASRTRPIRNLLVFTKSHSVLEALLTLRSRLARGARIILFQNGLGSQRRVLEHFDDFQVFAAVTTEGANRPEPDRVVHAGSGCTWVGALNPLGNPVADLSACENLLAMSGLEVVSRSDIWEPLWHKLVINCSINPFTALAHCRNGGVPEQALFQRLWPALRTELTDLLRLAGYPLSEEELESRVFTVIENTADNLSSMLQDIRLGQRTEIDDINGFALRFLADLGRPHAANQQLWEQVRALEAQGKTLHL